MYIIYTREMKNRATCFMEPLLLGKKLHSTKNNNIKSKMRRKIHEENTFLSLSLFKEINIIFSHRESSFILESNAWRSYENII